MFDDIRSSLARRRVQPGDGRALARYRWWHLPGRALFHLPASHLAAGHPAYAVDIRHWQRQGSGSVVGDLYRDGVHVASSRLPALFPVEGGEIEVAMSGVGVKRCHLITGTGEGTALLPDPASMEGRRARFAQRHPAASALIAGMSVLVLLVGVAVLGLQLVEILTRIPPVAQSVGIVTSPIAVPLWLTVALGLAATVAAIERSHRLRHHWFLDSAGR